jgi:imidazolonepropionase-like amidohydrolase
MAALCACTDPSSSDTKVIVGATLLNGSQPPLQNAIVIVKDDVVSAIGTQQMTPIPPGSSKVEAYGKFVLPEQGGELKVGGKANLLISSSDPRTGTNIERRMANGRWVQ